MEPLISVVVVTYNRAQYLKEALDSILRQTFKNYEVILVDDGSVDNTKEIVEQYEGIRYIFQEHGGISKARNTAVKAAKGKWIATLDSDDLWIEDKLQKQVNYLQVHPDCRILYTAFRNFTNIPKDELNQRQKELLCTVVNRCLATALIDVRLFDEIGMFDETMEWGEDDDWVFRLMFFKVDTRHFIDEILYLRRVHSSNISSVKKELNNLMFWKMVIDSYRKTKRRIII